MMELVNQATCKRLASCPTVKLPKSVMSDNPEKLVFHGFADESKLAICAEVYTLVTYPNGRKEQHLLVAKSRIAPKNMSIPRLELVAAYMLAKLASNVTEAICNTAIDEIHMWSDSTTILYWLGNKRHIITVCEKQSEISAWAGGEDMASCANRSKSK